MSGHLYGAVHEWMRAFWLLSISLYVFYYWRVSELAVVGDCNEVLMLGFRFMFVNVAV